ncbi:peptidase S8/S53 domain-containing protein [Mycena olivaceomarginata]|nr:peptidase S8/S53 domain-containing protein [Mycena olivaceomarginata]
MIAVSARRMVVHESLAAAPGLLSEKLHQPSSATTSAFNSFASAHGLNASVISPNEDWVSITFRGRMGSMIEHVQHNKRAASCDTSLPGGFITPACLQSIYGIPATPATQSKQLRSCSREANLDIQYTAGIATGVPLQFLSVGGPPDPPTVVSTSYSENEEFFGFTMAEQICNGYMALGARGISGADSTQGGVRGGARQKSANATTTPSSRTFPPSCPWVTSIGSTIGIGPETAVKLYGRRILQLLPYPFSYQSDAVAGFLEQLPTAFQGIFNSNGRGYPDISIQGSHFEIVLGGKHTAEAEPPVLGFLNPFLYYYASTALTDITAGHNSGVCPVSTVRISHMLRFDAGVGWDPLTGSGTPIFDQLLAAAMGTAPGSDTGALHTSGAAIDAASALSSDAGTDGNDGAVRKYAPIVIGLLSGNLLLLLILVILGVGVYVRRGGAVGRSSKYVPVRLGEEESMGKRYSD